MDNLLFLKIQAEGVPVAQGRTKILKEDNTIDHNAGQKLAAFIDRIPHDNRYLKGGSAVLYLGDQVMEYTIFTDGSILEVSGSPFKHAYLYQLPENL
jgi:hypothetical protein